MSRQQGQAPAAVEQDIKSLLVKYYQSKRNIPLLISEARQTQLTLDQTFVELKLIQDDQNNKDSFISVDKLLEDSESVQKKQLGMVVKGGPGSGKSTLLDKIAYTWAKDVKEKRKKVDFDYVFRIDLKKLDTAKVKKQQNFDKLIFYSLIQAFQFKEDKDGKIKQERQKRLLDEMTSIWKKAKNYKFMFLLDGYDEVKHFEGDQSLAQSNSLSQIFKNVKNHNTIITSRPQAMEGSKSLEDFKKIIQIQPLQEKSINNFINIMFQKQDRQKAEELKRHVKSNKNVMRIMQSPLNLTMVCLIFLNEDIQNKGLNLQLMNEIFLYDKMIKLITLRQENKKFMNNLNRQDLQKTILEGTLYEEIEPLHLLKETVFNIFKNGILTIKKEDIGKCSNKKYDEKRNAIRRTIDFGLLKKNQGDKKKKNNPNKAQQDEQYAFIHLSFAEYLFAYSIFQKLKYYIPRNHKNVKKQTSNEQLMQITSFIANNRYKTSFFNSFRYLTMLCSKYFNEQRVKYEKQVPKKRNIVNIQANIENDDELRYFKFPLETIWICFTCNIDGVIEFGKQQRLKLIIQMVGLSNYKGLLQITKIQILETIKNKFIEPYFSLKDQTTKERNKKSFVRWYKYFVNSNYFPSKLTEELVQEIQKYIPEKDGEMKLKSFSKLDEDYIVAFCQIISCSISSKINRYFTLSQNKIKCLDIFLKLLQKAQIEHDRIRYSVLSNLQDVFHSLRQNQAIVKLFKKIQNGQEADLIQIILQQLGYQQSNQIAFKLLCYFVEQEKQIKLKCIKPEQQVKPNPKKILSQTNPIKNQPKMVNQSERPFNLSEQMLLRIKNGSISKRILLSLKKELVKILQLNLDNIGIQQSTLFSQITDKRLISSEPNQAKVCRDIQQEIKNLYITDIQKRLKQNFFNDADDRKGGILNNLVKEKMYIIYKFYSQQQRLRDDIKQIIKLLDNKNTKYEISSAVQQSKDKNLLDMQSLMIQILQQKSKVNDYYVNLKSFYLNKNIINGYGHYIKGDSFINLMEKVLPFFNRIRKEQSVELISILCDNFLALLKFMQKASINKGVDLIVNQFMTSSLADKFLNDDFQKGAVKLFSLLKEGFHYIGKIAIKQNLSKIIPSLSILVKMATEQSIASSNVIRKNVQEIRSVQIKAKALQHDQSQQQDIAADLKNQEKEKKQTKISALIIIIEFLQQTVEQNTDQDLVNMIKSIMIPLCTYFDPNENREFKYDNAIKLAVIQFIKSAFQAIKSQKLLVMLKQMSIKLTILKKNTKKQERKRLEKNKLKNENGNQIAAKQQNQKEKQQPKSYVNYDQQFHILEIIGIGIRYLNEKERVSLIQSHLNLFQNPKNQQPFRKGILLMNSELFYLRDQQQDIQQIIFNLLANLKNKQSKISKRSLINYLKHATSYINNDKLKAKILQKMIYYFTDVKQLFECASTILISGASYLKDQTIKIAIIKSVVPFLSCKNKRLRLRVFKFLKQVINIRYDDGAATLTLFQTMQIMQSLLSESNYRGRINAILIINEALQALYNFNFNSFLERAINAIIPMIRDKIIKVSKCAVQFMGNVICIVKQQSHKYFQSTYLAISLLLDQKDQQLRFNAIQYMKKALPFLEQQKFLVVWPKISINFQNIQDKIISNIQNEDQLTKQEKNVVNMSIIFLAASFNYVREQILLWLFGELPQIREKEKIYNFLNAKMFGAIIDRSDNLSIEMKVKIFNSASRVILNNDEKIQTRTELIYFLANIIDPYNDNEESEKLARKAIQLVTLLLKNDQDQIKLASIKLIFELYQCLHQDQLKFLLQFSMHLLSDNNDKICLSTSQLISTVLPSLQPQQRLKVANKIIPLLKDDSFQIKNNSAQCLINVLPTLNKLKEYKPIVISIVKLINNLIKNRQEQHIQNQHGEALPKQQNSQEQIISENQIIPIEDSNDKNVLQQQTFLKCMILMSNGLYAHQEIEQLKDEIRKSVYFPALADKSQDIRKIVTQFITLGIIQQIIKSGEIVEHMVNYMKNCDQNNQEYLIQSITLNILTYLDTDELKKTIKRILPLFNKLDKKSQIKIQQLIRQSLRQIEEQDFDELYIDILKDSLAYRSCTYDKLYFVLLIMEHLSDQKKIYICQAIFHLAKNSDIQIREKVRNIIQLVTSKLSQYYIESFVDQILSGLKRSQDKQKVQILNCLINCLPYLSSKISQSYIRTIQQLLKNPNNKVRQVAIKLMEKSIQQWCLKKQSSKQALIVKFLPLFKIENLGFEDIINLVQMIQLHLDEKDRKELLKYLQPFFQEKNIEIFLSRVKYVKDFLPSLDSSIKKLIFQNSKQFFFQTDSYINSAIQIIHSIVPLFQGQQQESFYILRYIIPLINNKDQEIKQKVTEILKDGIFYQQSKQNRAILLMNLLLSCSEIKSEQQSDNYLHSTQAQIRETITVSVDRLMKLKSLSLDFNLLHQRVSLMDMIQVAVNLVNKNENIINFFSKILEIENIFARQSTSIAKLLRQFPLFNSMVAEKIKSKSSNFIGKKFLILIHLAQANNYIYGVVLQLYSKILQETQKILKDPNVLKQLQQIIKNGEVDKESFFTKQLLKKMVMLCLNDKQLSEEDKKLLNICIQCDITISFRYNYEQKGGFENSYKNNYSIEFGDKRFPIACKQNQNFFIILRELFKRNQGREYAKHISIFVNNEKNGLKKAAIDSNDSKEIFLNHKKVINKLINQKQKDLREKFLLVDWDSIKMLHLTYKQKRESEDIYLIMRRDQFGNLTARKFQAKRQQENKEKQIQKMSQMSFSVFQQEKSAKDNEQAPIKKEKQIKPNIIKKDNKTQKQYKDYVLHLSQFKQNIKAFKVQLIGQNNEKVRKNYDVSCLTISLEDYQESYSWSLQDLKQFMKKKKRERNTTIYTCNTPKWALLGQAVKPYLYAAQDIQNIEQILQITGLTNKSKLKKALKKLGKTDQEKQKLAQYTKIAYWKLLHMVESYGLVDCGILKKEQTYRTRDGQYQTQDTFGQIAEFFGDTIAQIPVFGQMAKTCVDFLANQAKASIERKQKNQMTAFILLFQQSSSSVEERNLLIDQVILELTKKRMNVLLSQEQNDKVPILFDAYDKIKQLKGKIQSLLLQDQIATKLSSNRTSIMAKMDVATLSMAIMSNQSKIIEVDPERQAIPALLMKYLDEQIVEDEKEQKTGCKARLTKFLLAYENCFRCKDNQQYQYNNLSCWQRVKKYLGSCFCCCQCQSKPIKQEEHIQLKDQESTHEKFKSIRKKNANSPDKLEQSFATESIIRKQL